MSGVNRMPAGGEIRRDRPMHFTFNGRRLAGCQGDTVASALLANGVTVTGRSFKYHRPRGIMSAGVEEPGAHIELCGNEACGNEAAPMVALRDGLQVRSVNCWPSAEFDLGGINQLLAPFIPASFYYKTFFWPSWRFYEPLIRQAAGLASAPPNDPGEGRFETRNHGCDIFVAGAGAAGLMAAKAAAAGGLRVVVADLGSEPGGRLRDCPAEIDGMAGAEWARRTAAELGAMRNVLMLRNTLVWACREHNLLMARERFTGEDRLERNWTVRAKRLIVATGASERAMVFAGNDRPGVMLASAVQSYTTRFAVRPGRRAVLFTNNDSALDAALTMQQASIDVAAIVDTRPASPDAEDISAAGIRIIHNAEIKRTLGHKRVRVAVVRHRTDNRQESIGCDLVAVSGGWSPACQLWSQARLPLAYDGSLAAFLPAGENADIRSAGAATGCFGLPECLRSGAEAGQAAAADLGRSVEIAAPQSSRSRPYRIAPWWHSERPYRAGKSFVDIMNDVTLADIHLALREGYRSVELVKRYTTAGMGLDQGRTGNVNVIGAIALQAGQDPGDVGVTTFRPPVAPVSFGAVQGLREGSAALPYRHTPVTKWNIDRGTVMYEAGARWRRPGYFPQPEESMLETVNREAMAVRTGVAVYDGSPLGTFALKGRDAGKLLNMLYTNDFSNLAERQGRYGIMLTDDGRILDDGVSFRTGPCEFLMSVSTGNAALVFRHIQKFLAVERPEWQVEITDLTCQWMNATVCGPQARDLVASLGTDIDLAPERFPFMGIRSGTVAGFPARIARVSFTGELSFEINVRARDLLQLWQAVMEAGGPFGIVPIGSETNHVLRVEKGFLSLGHEADGTVDPYDLGMGWIMSETKEDHIGRRSVRLRRQSGKPRRELVGLKTLDAKRVVPEGAPLTPGGRREASEGFVTASVWSECIGRSVTLALLKNGRSRKGETAHIRLPDAIIAAEITGICAYDPAGARLRG